MPVLCLKRFSCPKAQDPHTFFIELLSPSQLGLCHQPWNILIPQTHVSVTRTFLSRQPCPNRNPDLVNTQRSIAVFVVTGLPEARDNLFPLRASQNSQMLVRREKLLF